jgi:hypothetical protein
VSGRSGAALLLLLASGPTPLAAQGGATVLEWGAHATYSSVGNGVMGLVVGPRGAIRTIASTRVAVSLGMGIRGDSLTGRGEAALEYLLAPRAVGRLGVYMGGGLTGVIGAGKGGYLLVYLGVEQSPGRPRGWAIEAGLGDGFRIRAAYHWRRFPLGWRAER